MDDFLRDLALLLIGAFVGSFVAPFVTQLRTMPLRTKISYRESDRAWLDHKRWFERHDRALIRELNRIDEEMNARGLFESTIRLNKRAEVIQEFNDKLVDHWSDTIRRIEDVAGFPGRIEKAYMKWWAKRHGQNRSPESFLIEGAMKRLEKELNDEENQLKGHE